MVRELDLKSSDPKFNFHSDHELDLRKVVPGSMVQFHGCACTYSTDLPPTSRDS